MGLGWIGWLAGMGLRAQWLIDQLAIGKGNEPSDQLAIGNWQWAIGMGSGLDWLAGWAGLGSWLNGQLIS